MLTGLSAVLAVVSAILSSCADRSLLEVGHYLAALMALITVGGDFAFNLGRGFF